MTTTTAKRPRKTIEQQIEVALARAQKLQKKKAEQEKRNIERLRSRLGTAAIDAGFTDDWTDAQLERAMALAVKARDPIAKPSPSVPSTKAAVAPASPSAAPKV